MGVSFDPRAKRKPYTAYHYDLGNRKKQNLGTFATEAEAIEAFHAYLKLRGIALPEAKKPSSLKFGVIR